MDGSVKLTVALTIAGIVLWFAAASHSEPPTPGKTGFEGVDPLDWALFPNGSLAVVFVNRDDALIDITPSLTYAQILAPGEIAAPCALEKDDPPKGIRPGGVGIILFDGCIRGGENAVGDYYKAAVTIAYDDGKADTTKKSAGTVWGPIG